MQLESDTKKTAFVLAVLSLVAILGVLIVTQFAPPTSAARPRLTTLIQLKLFFSTVAVLLLIVLFIVYLKMYRSLPTQFTLTLLLFVAALILYAVTSNPLLPILFGFPVREIGPFTFLPELFASLAVAILLHQSLK